jgi:AcrR family transcriptional regulator
MSAVAMEERGELVRGFIEAGMNEIAARILSAAVGLFAQKGYAATSVREIVQEARVTNPMLYYYFESKEGVFARLIEVLFEAMFERIEEALSSHESVEAQLREVARSYFESWRENPEVLRFIYGAIFGPTQGRPECRLLEYLQGSDRGGGGRCDPGGEVGAAAGQ